MKELKDKQQQTKNGRSFVSMTIAVQFNAKLTKREQIHLELNESLSREYTARIKYITHSNVLYCGMKLNIVGYANMRHQCTYTQPWNANSVRAQISTTNI